MVMRSAGAAERHILYGQYTSTATSFANAGGWVPQAEVDDADQRAFAKGKRWVDDRG